MDYIIDLDKMQQKKCASFRLAEAFERIADDVVCCPGPTRYRWRSRAAQCRSCGTYLKYGVFAGSSDVKLIEANFCRQRLCPQCSFRRSLKVYSNISAVLDFLEPQNYKYLFLTLTVKNVDPPDLGDALSMMAKGFHRFMCNDAILRRIYGIIRSTEVTYNSKTGTFHPHYHLIVAVDKSYKRGSDDYFTTDQWSNAFGKACRLDYHPITDVRTIRGSLQDGIKETAKYAVKDVDFLLHGDGSQDSIIYFLQVGLHRKRLLSFTGVFADARNALALEDEEKVLTDQILRDDVFQAIVTYRWNYGFSSYELTEVVENETKKIRKTSASFD